MNREQKEAKERNFTSYASYLRSDIWKSKRARFWKSKRGRHKRCYCCEEKKATQVHHVRYKHPLGTETLKDLVGVCGTCHQEIHRLVREKGWTIHGATRRCRTKTLRRLKHERRLARIESKREKRIEKVKAGEVDTPMAAAFAAAYEKAGK